MSGFNDKLNTTPEWHPRMSPPASFTRQDAAKWQTRLNESIGTRNGRPLTKLAWAPDELRWHPHRMESEPKGYTFPIFIYGSDESGEKIAAPRWVLLERIEPEQFARNWERGRYSRADGSMWDWKGPCPTEQYVELRAHCYHDGQCCPCQGQAQCKCDPLFTCWGNYLDPNERLFEWAKQQMQRAREDSDVQPTREADDFVAPKAQLDVATRHERTIEKQEAEVDEFTAEMTDHWIKNPSSTNGFRKTSSGLYLAE